VLFPAYETAGGDASGIEKIGLSNVEQESTRLWAPAVMMYVMTIVILFFIRKNYYELVELRKYAMKKGESSDYTIIVTQIPEEYDSGEKIQKFLDSKYPNQIAHVRTVHDLAAIEKKTTELQKNTLKLALARKKQADLAPGEGPVQVKLGCLGLCGEKVDAIPHFTKVCAELREEIEKMYKDGPTFSKAAFVTFSSVSTAIKAANTMLAEDGTWVVQSSTRREDVLWKNLGSQPSEEVRTGLSISSTAAIAGIIVFWAIPVAFGGALSNLEQLGNDYSFLSGVNSLPDSLIAIIEGFGPTVWRVVLMILLQPILYFLLRITGMVKFSELERSFMLTYYMFLLVHIYFVTLLASSIFSTINDIVDDPVSIFELLGEAIPTVAVEMIQYMLLQGLALGVQKIVRLVGLILTILFTKLASVEYQKKKAETPPDFQYGPQLSIGLLMWTITCAYATIAPLILPFAVIYFFLDYVVQKYQLLQVHRPNFETFGTFWPAVVSIMLNGLVLSQVALMAIIALRFGAYQQVLLFPLPIFTYIYKVHLRGTLGAQMATTKIPLFNAVALDEARPKASVKAFIDKAHEMKMWSQECVLVDLTDPLKDLPDPPVLESAALEMKRDDSVAIGANDRRDSTKQLIDSKRTDIIIEDKKHT